MSETRFTYGNLIVLYAVHSGSAGEAGLPDYILERVKVCLETYRMVMMSRPDKHKTMVMIIGDPEPVEKVKEALVRGGVKQEIIAIEVNCKNMAEAIDRVAGLIKNKPNPPFVYFVGSVWLHEIFDSTVVSKLKGFRIQFYGALDHRPVDEVEREKTLDIPRKSVEYYKQKGKNKAVDALLNVIFPD